MKLTRYAPTLYEHRVGIKPPVAVPDVIDFQSHPDAEQIIREDLRKQLHDKLYRDPDMQVYVVGSFGHPAEAKP